MEAVCQQTETEIGRKAALIMRHFRHLRGRPRIELVGNSPLCKEGGNDSSPELGSNRVASRTEGSGRSFRGRRELLPVGSTDPTRVPK